MIICGLIQSPEENNDQVIVKQSSGEEQSTNSIINAIIALTSNQPCADKNEIKIWKEKKTLGRPNELYISVPTNSKDYLGRTILFGIYLKKENDNSAEISKENIDELLNKFPISLTIDDEKINIIVNLVNKSFFKKTWALPILIFLKKQMRQ